MKKLVLMVAAVATMALTSCNEKAESASIDQENLTAAAANKEVAGNFPEMTFMETEYDFGTVEEGAVVVFLLGLKSLSLQVLKVVC